MKPSHFALKFPLVLADTSFKTVLWQRREA